MRRPAMQLFRLSVLSLMGIQLSCGSSDSSGPPVVEPCTDITPHTLGTNVNGTLASTDCRSPLKPDSYTDFYRVTLPQAGTYLLSESSLTIDTFMLLLNTDGTLIGANDDVGASTDSRVKAILPAGDYLIGASSFDPNTRGSYAMASASTTAGVTCEVVFAVPGIITPQNLEAGDCEGPSFRATGTPGNGTRYDPYIIELTAGESITITMTSSALDSYVEIFGGNPLTRLAFNDNSGAGQNAQVTFTAPAAGPYFVSATSTTVGATGAYALQIQ